MPSPASPRDSRRLSLEEIVREAQRLWMGYEKNSLRISALIRQLYDSKAHRQFGFRQFGEFCESKFPGMTATQARRFSQQGAVVLELEDAGRIDWSGESAPDRGVPATTGVRALAPVLFKQGPEEMVRVYDRAMILARGVPATDRHVKHVLAADRVPRDQPDPRPRSEALDVEEVEGTEEHAVLLDALGELDEKVLRVVETLEDEQLVLQMFRLGQAPRLRELLTELEELTSGVREAWEAFEAAAEQLAKDDSPR